MNVSSWYPRLNPIPCLVVQTHAQHCFANLPDPTRHNGRLIKQDHIVVPAVLVLLEADRELLTRENRVREQALLPGGTLQNHMVSMCSIVMNWAFNTVLLVLGVVPASWFA